MKHYKILSAKTERTLEKNVKEYLLNGWKLAGGVSVVVGSDGKKEFYQAIVI